MTILTSALSLLFFTLYLYQRSQNHLLQQELLYIKNRISSISDTSRGQILIPSETPGIQELSAELNRLLDVFYAQRADFERARQSMTQTLANISHDLRTPLTVLKGCLELLRHETRKEPVSPELRQMAEKADTKAQELVTAVNAYFTLSKIESGDMQLDVQNTDITQLCHEILLDYYDILEQEQYEVQIETGSAPVFVRTDAQAAKRILKNLIDNAVKHGGFGKYIGIRLLNTSENVRIEIEDHGPGIAPKHQELIFSRNYTAGRRSSGSGLGLAIAKKLAQQIQADIRFTSQPDVKTVFTLVLKC